MLSFGTHSEVWGDEDLAVWVLNDGRFYSSSLGSCLWIGGRTAVWSALAVPRRSACSTFVRFALCRVLSPGWAAAHPPRCPSDVRGLQQCHGTQNRGVRCSRRTTLVVVVVLWLRTASVWTLTYRKAWGVVCGSVEWMGLGPTVEKDCLANGIWTRRSSSSHGFLLLDKAVPVVDISYHNENCSHITLLVGLGLWMDGFEKVWGSLKEFGFGIIKRRNFPAPEAHIEQNPFR
ncbi:hypothetical protein Tco_0805087 [Tanacetum coccineum]